MQVQGAEVSESHIAACIQRMKASPFRAGHVIDAAKEAGFGFPMRLADRLIAREKKAGNIELKKLPSYPPEWVWVGSK